MCSFVGLGEISWKLRNGVITLCLQMEGMEVNCLIPYFPLRQIIRGDMVPPLKIRKVFFPLLKGGVQQTRHPKLCQKGQLLFQLCAPNLLTSMTSRHHLQKFSHTAWGYGFYAHIHPLCGLVPILYTHIVGLCSFSLRYLYICVIHPYLVLGSSRLEIRGCDYRPQSAQPKFSEPNSLCKSM